MRNLVLTLLLLVGCSGHPNPDPAAADGERRERALQASVGRRASLVRRDAERPVVTYDVKELVCPDVPDVEARGGVIPVLADEDDGCKHLDIDELFDLVYLTLGDDHGRFEVADTDLDVLVVVGAWSAHERVGALLAERAADARSCRRCPRHGRPDHGRSGSNPVPR